MQPLKFAILRKGETIKPQHAIDKNAIEITCANVNVIEAGMTNGKTAMLFHFKDEAGFEYYWQTSKDLMKMAVDSIGAVEEFQKNNPIE